MNCGLYNVKILNCKGVCLGLNGLWKSEVWQWKSFKRYVINGLSFYFLVGSKIHLVQCPWMQYLLKHNSDFPPSPPPFNWVFQNVHVMFHTAPFQNLCMHLICTNMVIVIPMLLRSEHTKIILFVGRRSLFMVW